MVVSPLLPELSRRRRSPGEARCDGLVRGNLLLVRQVRAQVRCQAAEAARSTRRHLVPGRGFRQHPRPKTWLITDKLRSYGAAHKSVMPSVEHVTARYANNRAEVSHQPTRQRERQMRRFKSAAQPQRCLSVHEIVRNLFNLSRHRLRSADYRLLRTRAFQTWVEAIAA